MFQSKSESVDSLGFGFGWGGVCASVNPLSEPTSDDAWVLLRFSPGSTSPRENLTVHSASPTRLSKCTTSTHARQFSLDPRNLAGTSSETGATEQALLLCCTDAFFSLDVLVD